MSRVWVAVALTLVLTASQAVAASPDAPLSQALARECPQRRWPHASMGAYEQPLNAASAGLSVSEHRALEEAARLSCRGVDFGMACDNRGRIQYLLRTGHLRDMVRAFCAIQPDTFD